MRILSFAVIGFLFITLSFSLSCGFVSIPNRAASDKDASNTVPSNVSLPTTDSEPAPPAGVERNLLSFAAGTIMVEPEDSDAYHISTGPILIIDDSDIQSWVSRDAKPVTFVLELPQKATINKLVVNNDPTSMGGSDSGVRDIVIEVSDTSATAGFQQILSTSLVKAGDHQVFSIAKPVSGRWLRASLKNNFGGEFLAMAEIRAYGEQQPLTLSNNLGGTYSDLNGEYHIKQEGASVIGCYQPSNLYRLPAIFSGGVDGNIAKVDYVEKAPEGESGATNSSFLMVFDRSGKRFFTGEPGSEGGLGQYVQIKKTSDSVGACEGFNSSKTTVKDKLANDLEQDGRVRIYGINFDFNSDVIRPESKSVIDQVAAMLKDKADMKLLIEGHTDSIGGEKFNQELSDRRANAVKRALVATGIDAARLRTVGKGMSTPISSNESEVGRAQNRRVELVKE